MERDLSLPEGTITMLFTDVEGSTGAWERFGGVYGAVIDAHYRVLRESIREHDGAPVWTEGDSCFAVFARASDAVRCAAAVQQRLTAHAWPPEIGTPRVRMGLHTGELRLQERDYYGPPVNRAARIQAAGHGGQILLSGVTLELARAEMGETLVVRSLGRHRLKDLAEPELLYELQYPGMASGFPPLRTLEFVPHNLPVQLTSFIGREREMAQVREQLAGTRLLTLTGTGGLGKTRLALQVAAELLEAYRDGVWLVELAALSDPALVPQAVASALGVREETGRSLMTTLTDYLRSRELLLLLDNCEHLVAACAALAHTLLTACPGLQVLATSREALGIAGETVWLVPSLSLPGAEPALAAESVTQFEAVRLFIERAVLSQPGFHVTNANAPAVAQICHRLDGIPLAIELAAARVRVLPPEQIATRLDDRFRLLTGGSRAALPRQQTLRAAMDWSYELLSENERALLRRLSVFAGGWALEAAEAVCAGDLVDGYDVLDLSEQLAAKSLVSVDGQDNEPRYRLLETVRQYAQEHLERSGERPTLRGQQRDWFLALAEQAVPELLGPDQGSWLDRLESEHDNLRAALRWCVESGDVDGGLRLGGALYRFWSVRGHIAEGRGRLAELLVLPGAAPRTVARAGVLHGAGRLAEDQADYPAAGALYDEALAIRRELGDRRGVAETLNNVGLLVHRRGDYETEQRLHEEALAIRRELGDTWGIAASLGNLGGVAFRRCDYPRARALFEQALATWRQRGDQERIAIALHSLASISFEQGDYERAKSLYEECLAIRRALGNRQGTAVALSSLGLVALNQGDPTRARALYEEALTLHRAVGDRWSIAFILDQLGRTSFRQGDAASARSLHQESLAIFLELGARPRATQVLRNLGLVAMEMGDVAGTRAFYEESLAMCDQMDDKRNVANLFECFAELMAQEGQPERALRLAGVAAALREAIGAPLTPTGEKGMERALAPARDALGEEASAAALTAGRAMTLEQAVETAYRRDPDTAGPTPAGSSE
jgi:predicted ATPase/class 3 adenylate cyclase